MKRGGRRKKKRRSSPSYSYRSGKTGSTSGNGTSERSSQRLEKKKMRETNPDHPTYSTDSRFTWVDKGVLPEVQSQGDFQTCGTHVLSGVVAAKHKLQDSEKPLVKLSRQDMVNFAYPDEKVFTGISMQEAFDYAIEKGIALEEDIPYLGPKQLNAVRPPGPKYFITDYTCLDYKFKPGQDDYNFKLVCEGIERGPLVGTVKNSVAFDKHTGEGVFKSHKLSRMLIAKEKDNSNPTKKQNVSTPDKSPDKVSQPNLSEGRPPLEVSQPNLSEGRPPLEVSPPPPPPPEVSPPPPPPPEVSPPPPPSDVSPPKTLKQLERELHFVMLIGHGIDPVEGPFFDIQNSKGHDFGVKGRGRICPELVFEIFEPLGPFTVKYVS